MNPIQTTVHALRTVAALAMVFSTPSLAQVAAPPAALATPTTLAAIATPIHTAADAEGVPYGIWAAGAGYKVSFHGGMTFVPYVGKGEASPTLAWRTLSARVGELELATATPVLQYGDWRAQYDLGGIVEAYDVRANGLEQTFVLAKRPAANGDLVIRGAVTTTLEAVADGDGGLAFVDAAGRRRVHYGAATAIDAAGRHGAMTTTLTGDGIELRLPAAWLAEAAFPLVVDPLLAPTTVGNGAEVTATTLVHETNYIMNFWYAEVRVSGTDHDLRLFRLDNDGLNPVLVFSDLSASWSAEEPSLGRNSAAMKVLLAYTRHVFATDRKRVRMHLHDRTDTGYSASVFDVPSPSDENHWRPAVGSDLSPISFTSLLVIYQVEGPGTFATTITSEIQGTVVLCGAGGSTGNQIVIAAAAAIDHERPAISTVAVGPTRSWTVAYQRYYSGAFGFEWDLGLRRISAVNIVSSETVIDNGVADRHEMTPHMDGRDDRLMLFYTASTVAESSIKPYGVNGHRIRGTRLDWDGNAFVQPWGSNELQVNNDARLEILGAAYDIASRGIWGLAFRSNVTQTVYFRTYGYRGVQRTSDVVEAPATASGTSVLGGLVYRVGDDGFALAYGLHEPGVGSYSRLCRWQFPSLTTPYHTGTACTSTQLDWWGSQHIGAESCGVVYTQAPANSFTLCLLATNTATLQLFGIGGVHDGCWLLVPLNGPDYLGILGPSTATAMQFQLSLPEGLPSMWLRFQAVTFDGATGEFHSSDRLTVPIGL